MFPPTCLTIAAAVICTLIPVANASDFTASVQPILRSKCHGCHGSREQTADVRLDDLSTDLVKQPLGAETWHDALNAINRGEMPPADEPQLTSDERRIVTNWIFAELNRLKKSRRATGGRVILRRLNRSEYQNTMVDLLGVDRNFIANLPPDPVSEDGFRNNGSALKMSGLQLEYYLQAARMGLASAIVEGAPPKVLEHSATESVADKAKNKNWTTRLGRSGHFVARVPEFPDQGEFEIRVRAHAEIPDNAPWPIMQVKLGFRSDVSAPEKIVDVVEVPNAESREFIFRGRLEEFPIQSRTQSKYPGMLIWIDNVYSDGQPAPKPVPVKQNPTDQQDGKGKKKRKAEKLTWPEDPSFPKIIVEQVSFRAPVFESWPPRHHTNIIPRLPTSDGDEITAAEAAINHFLPRAFRRPITDDDRNTLLTYFRTLRPTADSFEAAMRETLAMALVSPDFLYLAEPRADASGLNNFELASRLSYFLWNTMPDDELMQLAEQGRLSDHETLREQTDRLLADARSDRFVRSFSTQWLDLAGTDRVAVNPEFYPDFDNRLKPYLQQETQEFFREILRSDLSALKLLNADFSMLNQPLAKHYGIEDGPRGISFQRVNWSTDANRGGLLGHASVLLANSTGDDSHPIKRAVWIRDRLLNDPPAPPPPDVPDLNQDLPEIASLPLKEQLKLHLENDACADCHHRIDPWGVALDGFGATGRPRDQISRPHPKRRGKTIMHPVETSVELPDGTQVNGFHELRDYLVEDKANEFTRSLTSRLLTYAIGRSLEFTDEEAVNELTTQFKDSDYRIKELIKSIVCSKTFQN